MFNSLLNSVSGSPVTYSLIVGVCAADAVLPLFPAETVVITAAVLASRGRLEIGLVVLAATVGAMIGDNCAYALGRSGLRRVVSRLLGSERNQRRLAWGRRQLQQRGAWIIIIARFIPGGRTATTYIAGTLGMPWARSGPVGRPPTAGPRSVGGGTLATTCEFSHLLAIVRAQTDQACRGPTLRAQPRHPPDRRATLSAPVCAQDLDHHALAAGAPPRAPPANAAPETSAQDDRHAASSSLRGPT